ncbi:MAG: transporter substrate-binding domain-containing protein, partial [Opitutaceae bacterium]|nr:transporter substrate-binding domain-containing protein [Verrucomicrobiales bacterium]
MSAIHLNAASVGDPLIATPRGVELSPAESAWLRQHPVWRVSADPAWPPFSEFDGATRWSGIDLDIIRMVAGKIGAQIELLPATSWPDLQERLKARDVDIVTGTAHSAERIEMANFTDAYLSFPVAIITRDAAPFLVGLSGLEGRKVAVPRNYITAESLLKDFPAVITITTTNAEQALKLLSRGEVDAVVENLAVASYFIRENRVIGLKVGGIAPYHFDLRFAVRKDWPELIGILNKGLAAIPQRDRVVLADRWVNVDFQDARGWRKFSIALLLIAGTGGVALVLTLWWTRRLALEVERRKQAETALIEEKQRAEQASRMKSDFLADMSHEIRNPLTAVLGNADLLGLDNLSDRARHCLNGIITGGQTLLGVVNDILDLSRIEAG